jgi:hypothetical protein
VVVTCGLTPTKLMAAWAAAPKSEPKANRSTSDVRRKTEASSLGAGVQVRSALCDGAFTVRWHP